MEQICSREKCTGCGLCSNLCPKQAISMKPAPDTGHFVSVINQEKCIDCRLCEKSCPALREPVRKKSIKTYAAWRKEREKQIRSSSGGVAAAFYETAIAAGYTVVGTYLDNEFRAKMKCTSDISDCESFKGSKYIQAQCGTVYSDALKILKSGKNILFIGLPCQCAAMRSAARNYEKQLLTVELICHGTPSQRVFLEYIHGIAKKKKRNLSRVDFRSPWGIELSLYDGEKPFWKYRGNEDDFLVAFQTGVLHNTACYSCTYADKDRCSDITIGDFWKIGTTIPFEKPSCKVSVVIVNSQKGNDFISLCDNLNFVERTYDEAMVGNPQLYRPSNRSLQYDMFWKAYHESGIDSAMKEIGGDILVKKRIKNKVKRAIKETVKRIFK